MKEKEEKQEPKHPPTVFDPPPQVITLQNWGIAGLPVHENAKLRLLSLALREGETDREFH